MFRPIRAGLILGLLVAVWTLVHGSLRWYCHPVYNSTFVPVAILLQVAVMLWCLAGTRQDTFRQQFTAGLALSVTASAVIFLQSWIATTWIFPDYFQNLQAMGRELLLARGLPPAEVEVSLKAYAAMATPFRNAFAGVMGTWATGFVLSVALGALFRRRD